MNSADIEKVADLLGLIHIPSIVDVPTAVQCSEACTELARLQQSLREWAKELGQVSNDERR